MTAPVSVIIPTLNVADRIGPCLGALGEALFDGLIREVILADGGSADAIEDVADAIGARLVTGRPGRGIQLGAGAEAATGAWFLFLHADTVLGEDWAQAVRGHINSHGDKAAYFRLQFKSDHWAARPVAGWANLRARVFGLPFGDQGLLVSRTAYRAAGGYPDMPLMEDVALARRLQRGIRFRALAAIAETSADRYEARGWLRHGVANLWRQVRYFTGTPPENLASRYPRS
ncbi:MAG: TIGR04283 family arsenosugar biosynthesis glycosyltransferase [Pseudomonadota bacterium]